MTSPQWLGRYLSGHREQVWHELRQAGRSIRENPDLAGEAQLVCEAMAHLARHNIEVIVERLKADGYQFHDNDDERTPATPHLAPTATAEEHADWLDERFGDVPMTIRAWTRSVGDVWLVGTHPQWPTSASGDPLVIELEGSRYPEDSIREYFDQEWTRWRESCEEGNAAGLFVLPLAPDQLHKDNVSGGPPYGIVLPDGCVDGLFVGETTMPFVSYLNHVFRHGGFPRSTGSQHEWRIKQDLAKDLQPL